MSLSWVAVDKTKDVVLLPQIELNANRWQSKPSKSESGGGGGGGGWLKTKPFPRGASFCQRKCPVISV